MKRLCRISSHHVLLVLSAIGFLYASTGLVSAQDRGVVFSDCLVSSYGCKKTVGGEEKKRRSIYIKVENPRNKKIITGAGAGGGPQKN